MIPKAKIGRLHALTTRLSLTQDEAREAFGGLGALLREREDFLDLLREVEWAGAVQECIAVCPACEAEQRAGTGHAPGCRLAAALMEAT